MKARRLVLGILGAAGALVGGGALLGWYFSAPKYRGPVTDHFDGKHFHNVPPKHHPGFTDMVRWGLTRDKGPWDEWRDIALAPPPPKRVAGGELRVTWVNHATLLIQTENVNILTDPIWSLRCSPVQWAGPKRHHQPGIRFEDLPPIDAVLISHNHYDHLDLPTLDQLKREHHPKMLAGLGNAAVVEGATALDWGHSVELAPGVRIHAVPARHFSSRGFVDRDANLWCGFVIETPHGGIYFAGDTGWGDHFAAIREHYGPMRLALLPIGAYRPEWFMSPVHVSPHDAIRAARVLEAEVSIPMHYFTFDLGDDGQQEPADVLKRELAATPGPRFEVLLPGQTYSAMP
ncbi:MAG: MBL fold metallo-hydrolase [Acidobacteriota bacterium]